MPDAQILLNAPERSLMSRLLNAGLKDIRRELRDVGPDLAMDFRQDILDKEAVVLQLLTKLQAASAALYATAP